MNQFSGNFFVLSTFFVCLASFECNYLSVNPESYMVIKLVIGGLIVVHLIIATGLGILVFLPVSKLHTRSSAIFHFVLTIVTYLIGWLNLKKIVKASKKLRATQHDLLMKMLARNADTEFGRKMGFAKIKTLEQYQAMVPLSTYEDYEPYVNRIAKGEDNLLTADPVGKFCVSSGTTGKCKLLPFVLVEVKRWIMGHYFPLLYRLLAAQSFPTNMAPLKALELIYVPNWRYTECGIPIGPISSYPRSSYLYIPYTTPVEAQALMSEPAQSYIHWLFALLDDNVKRITCSFGGTMLTNFEFFQKNWKQLADDIRNGHVTNTHNIPQEIVDQVHQMPIFIANPQRADEIEEACSKGFEGIIKRLWPKMENMTTICTGAHGIYRDRLKWYGGNGVKLSSTYFGASEAFIGMPVTDAQEESYIYTLLFHLTFFEFIPENEINHDNPSVLLADRLEIGKRYELVITSYNGFYRYRMGDIVCVVDFFNEVPVIEFCTRVGGIVDLRGEKTTEDMMIAALKNASAKWKGCRELLEFTVTDSLTLEKCMTLRRNGDNDTSCEFGQESSGQLYYAVFVEVDGVSRPLTDSEVESFDEALCSASYPYKSFRIKHAISKPKVFVVPHGTFEELKCRIIQTNDAFSNQYKASRYHKRPELVRFLVDSAFPN